MPRSAGLYLKIGIGIAFFAVTVLLLIQTLTMHRQPVLEKRPYFTGLDDIEVMQGDRILYRNGVTAYDGNGEELSYTVLANAVNVSVPGTYTAIYFADDSAGTRTVETVTVTVTPRIEPDEAALYEAIDLSIQAHGMLEMSPAELARYLYEHFKENMNHVSDSDKTNWVAEAWRGLREQEGDCFTYMALAKAYFTRCGVETITVQRTPGLRDSTHYWLLVNVGTADAPIYYHWDAYPRYKQYPIDSCLLTDDELMAYQSQGDKVKDYYAFDKTAYPATPKTPYSSH